MASPSLTLPSPTPPSPVRFRSLSAPPSLTLPSPTPPSPVRSPSYPPLTSRGAGGSHTEALGNETMPTFENAVQGVVEIHEKEVSGLERSLKTFKVAFAVASSALIAVSAVAFSVVFNREDCPEQEPCSCLINW